MTPADVPPPGAPLVLPPEPAPNDGSADRARRARVDPGAKPRAIDAATHQARVEIAAKHRDLACDERFRSQVRERLSTWAVEAIHRPDHKRAAVALAITDEGPGAGLPGLPRHGGWSIKPALILTRRAGSMRRHAGQWALPGGRMDEGETPEQAALRELDEEVGLTLQPEAILGRLDDFATRSGYIITPVVVWAGDARGMQAEPGEVRSIHRIPVSEFLRPDSPILEDVPHSPHPVLRMPVGNNWIAAPTGAMVHQFVEACVLGRSTRVAHFEQPMFAWK